LAIVPLTSPENSFSTISAHGTPDLSVEQKLTLATFPEVRASFISFLFEQFTIFFSMDLSAFSSNLLSNSFPSL
jgi:hypothetical protein